MTRTRFTIATWVALTALLMWPALLNGGPIIFFDSLAYFNAANIGLEQTIGLHSDVFRTPADLVVPVPPLDPSAVLSVDPSTGMAPAPVSEITDSSRSIYFALFLLILFQVGGLWAIPLVQAGIFAAALVGALDAWLPGRRMATVVIGAITAGFTAAPFFTSYMMPDFLAGLGVLALLRLMLPPAMTWPATLLWAALLCFALVSHMSHLLVGIGLFVCALVVLPLARLPVPRVRAALVAGTLCLAILAEMAFGYAVLRIHGNPLMRPPFVAARMIADGPGMTYLEQVCPPIPAEAVRHLPLTYDTPPPFELCRYRHRLPQSSLTILWSKDPEVGVYATATPTSRRLIAAEHFDFARGVVAHAPAAQITASLHRFAEQFTGFSLDEFHYSDLLRTRLESQLNPEIARDISTTRFFENAFPLHVPDVLSRSLTIVSAATLAALALGARRAPGTGPDEQARALWVLVTLVVLALAGNAAVTGILSAPHDRYQARIYWLLPLVAGLAVMHWSQLRHRNKVLV